jgi:hypothetical protein
MQFSKPGESNLLSSRKGFLAIISGMVAFALIFAVPVAGAAVKPKIPAGYTKWKDGSQFAYKWITKIPKDNYYKGTWQGVASIISVIYVNRFSCSPELPDGTTNSVEIEIDVLRTGNKGFSGRGFAQTIKNNGPFKIKVTFYGAPKGYGSLVRQVKLKTIECRM